MRASLLAAGPAVALSVALSALAGCSASEDPQPTAADAAGVGWSPCDGVTAKDVTALAGEPVTEENGTQDSPRCSFLPKEKGGPAYDVSYLFFDGGLDTALDAMGAIAQQLETVDVPGAEAARVAVREKGGGILVTGFVQTDGLVQSVNAVRLEPYDRDAMVTSTTELLALLVDRAPRQ